MIKITDMQSFILLFCILDHCYQLYSGDDLGGLLGAMSPELWADGMPIDNDIIKRWVEWRHTDEIDQSNILEEAKLFLLNYQKKFGFDFSKSISTLESLDGRLVEEMLQRAEIIYEKHPYEELYQKME